MSDKKKIPVLTIRNVNLGAAALFVKVEGTDDWQCLGECKDCRIAVEFDETDRGSGGTRQTRQA